MRAKRSDGGLLYVWTYLENRRNFPGWHLTADDAACARLSRTIQGLSAGSLSEPQVFPVWPVTPAVLAVPNNGRAKARSATELRVALAQEPRHFSLEERDGVLTIKAGSERLEELRKNLIGIIQKRGDHSMFPDGKRILHDQSLWFWWLLS